MIYHNLEISELQQHNRLFKKKNYYNEKASIDHGSTWAKKPNYCTVINVKIKIPGKETRSSRTLK